MASRVAMSEIDPRVLVDLLKFRGETARADTELLQRLCHALLDAVVDLCIATGNTELALDLLERYGSEIEERLVVSEATIAILDAGRDDDES
jgi:hypothetical protein